MCSPTPSGWPGPSLHARLTRARPPWLPRASRRRGPEIFGPRRSLEEAIRTLKALDASASGPHSTSRCGDAGAHAFPPPTSADARDGRSEGRRPTPGALLAAPSAAALARLRAQHLWASRDDYDRPEAPRDDRSPVRPLHPARLAAPLVPTVIEKRAMPALAERGPRSSAPWRARSAGRRCARPARVTLRLHPHLRHHAAGPERLFLGPLIRALLDARRARSSITCWSRRAPSPERGPELAELVAIRGSSRR